MAVSWNGKRIEIRGSFYQMTVMCAIAAAFRQHNRLRGEESKKLDKAIQKTIQDASSILSTDKDNPDCNPLEVYYSKKHKSKRRKTSECTFFCDNKAVFGRYFNPVDAKSEKNLIASTTSKGMNK
jgi:hypothetical protein